MSFHGRFPSLLLPSYFCNLFNSSGYNCAFLHNRVNLSHLLYPRCLAMKNHSRNVTIHVYKHDSDIDWESSRENKMSLMETGKPSGRLSWHSRILLVTASQLSAQGSRVIYTQGESETRDDSLRCTHERLMGKPHIDGVISRDKWLTRSPSTYSGSSVQAPNPSNRKSGPEIKLYAQSW